MLHRYRRFVGAWFVILLLLPGLIACAPIKQTVSRVVPSAGGTLRISGDPPEILDPAVAQDAASWTYLEQLYAGLVRLDDQLRVTPDLAASWTISPDGKTYTFTLRPDAKFQDGRPITADDFKYSLERTLDPATKSEVASVYLGDIVGAKDRLAGQAASVSGVTVVDPHTLRIEIEEPESYFLSKLTHPTAFVVDRKNVATGANWYRHPNASGPFGLKSYTPNDSLVLVRNPNYVGPSPSLLEVDYYLGRQPPISLYEQGKLDVATVQTGDVARVTDPTNPLHNQLVVTPTLSVSYLGFNVRQKPFDDPHVRRAFALATDKQRVINGLFRDTRQVASGILPPGLLGYDASFAGLPFDPNRARQELAESSYGSAANLPPIAFTVAPGVDQLGYGLAQMYHDVLGVNVSVVVLENSYYDDVQSHQVQMYFAGWIADYPDPQDFLEILLAGGSQANDEQYANPKVDDLFHAARIETDPAKRAALYQQAQQLVVDDAPVVPLFFDTEYTLVRPNVTGLKLTPMGIVSFVGVGV